MQAIDSEFEEAIRSKSDGLLVKEVIVAGAARDPTRRVMFGTSGMYLAFRYLLLFADKLCLAKRFSHQKTSSEVVYALFKEAVLLFLNEAIDAGGFEDLLRMLFDREAGAFLCLDRIVSAFVKHAFDETTDCVLDLHFGNKEDPADRKMAEEVLLSRVCHRQAEVAEQQQNTGKKRRWMADNARPAEVFKFEYLISYGLLIIHKLESVFGDNVCSLKTFLEHYYPLLSEPLCSKTRKSQKNRSPSKIANYSTFSFCKSESGRTVVQGHTEDVVLKGMNAHEDDTERRKAHRLK